MTVAETLHMKHIQWTEMLPAVGINFSRLQAFWLLSAVSIAFIGLLVLNFPHSWLYNLLTYGKFASRINKPLRMFWVPKSYFTHFYMCGVASCALCLLLAMTAVGQECLINLPFLRTILFWLGAPYNHTPSASNASRDGDWAATLLLLAVLQFHVVRRFWESAFVSVYSETHINIAHYLLGLTHYALLPCAVLTESSLFYGHVALKPNESIVSHLRLPYWRMLGLLLFAYCSWAQNKCFRVLAGIRRTKNGNILTYGHTVPNSSYFVWVACPHFLFECLLYVSLLFIAGSSYIHLRFVLAFVIVNQFVAARVTLAWYREHFPREFPANRQSLIPGCF